MRSSRSNRRVLGLLAVIVLVVTACSTGAKVLTEDSFISEMNAICRTATRAIDKLDTSAPSAVSQAADIMSTAWDTLTKLVPPKTLKSDFGDFTANLDDQITQATKLQKAIKAKDEAATNKISVKLDTLSKDGDKLATSIGADKCVGTTGGSSTSGTTADTTSNTSPPNTPLPILTTPIETAPLNTAGSSGSTTANSLDGQLKAPPGYTWATSDPYDATALFKDPVLGSGIASYSSGKLKSAADGSLTEVYIIEMKAAFTQAQTDAYLAFEGVAGGVDVTTPKGLPARLKVGAFNGADALVLNSGKIGISIVTATGVDGAPILDAVVYETK